MLIGVTAAAIGFAFDAGSGSKELSAVFAACYVLGCIGAVLAVRQAAVFTAVIQPPLILFVTVPGAYFLFTGSQSSGLRDLAINCGYPLIERFPLMFFTSAAVLLLGMFRWYYGASTRRGVPAVTEDVESKSSVASALTAKMSSLLHRGTGVDADDEELVEPPRRRRPREARATRSGRSTADRRERERSARRSTPSRSRHVRPPETEIIEPVAERPRRSRTARQDPPAAAEPREPRRRPRPPRQSGPPPSERRAGYDRAERRRRFDDYDLPPREPHRRNGNGSGIGSGNGTGTHHPISRVRYRGEEADDRAEYRTRRRTPRQREADSWEYDI